MKLKILSYDLTVCRVSSIDDLDLSADFYFIGKTAEEISLVCRTEDTPDSTVAREDGWNGFYIEGMLDFSLTGILSNIAATLADAGISIYAVSTYNTDYILVKKEKLCKAIKTMTEAGYEIEK